MTENANNAVPLSSAGNLTTPAIWLALVFACGAIVGGVGGNILTRHRMLTILRNPGQSPDRIMPLIRSKLALSNEQAEQIKEIIRQRYANMELLRAEIYPRQREEFTAMRDDVAPLLNEQQQAAWAALCNMVEQRYLPREPAGPPIDLIFFRFDANDDDILSEDEIPPRMWTRLSIADKDEDGDVTRDEFANSTPNRPTR